MSSKEEIPFYYSNKIRGGGGKFEKDHFDL